MPDPVWPATLPQAGAMNVTGVPQSNIISFEPEVGPTIDRRRASAAHLIRDITLPNITVDQYNDFVEFFRDTLLSGVLPFTWVDPFTGNPARVKFVQRQQPYQEEKITNELITLRFQLMTLRIEDAPVDP